MYKRQAQFRRAVAAQMLLLYMAVDIALINKGNFIFTAILTLHNKFLLLKTYIFVDVLSQVILKPEGLRPAS